MKSKYKNLIVTTTYIFVYIVSLVGFSISLSSFKEDRDFIILNELSNNSENTSEKKVLFSFPDYEFENTDEWNDYSHTFDSRFASNSYANIFRLIDDSELIIGNNNFELNICDITHYSDKFYNFGNVKLLESDGGDFSLMDENDSIYIDKFYADII